MVVIERDAGERFLQPGTMLRYLAQEPDFADFASVQDYVEAGLAPGDVHHRAGYLLSELGLTGREDPAKLSGGEARRTALARAMAPEWITPDIDGSVGPPHGAQEGTAWNGHFGCMCRHPLFVINRFGRLERRSLPPAMFTAPMAGKMCSSRYWRDMRIVS